MQFQSLHSTALVAVFSFFLFAEANIRFPPGIARVGPSVLPRETKTTLRSTRAYSNFPRSYNSTTNASCRYLPGDAAYPDETEWNELNDTVGGRLIRGTPLAEVCFGDTLNAAACSLLQEEWPTVVPFLDNPVNFMSPYWLNNSCSPFLGANGTCTLGNLASYAINVSDASSVIAGMAFARDKNIRLTIKNTGHDILGRSSGAGSLALWTHNMKNMTFFNYTSANYTGPAARVGAGVQVQEVYEAASAQGLRVTGGGCPTVGLAGGWLPGGGVGPLTAAYGLGADQTLEFEVVTTDGEIRTASPTENADLYWALSGGGAGNYAVVLSITLRAHADGPVAGSSFLFTNTHSETYWSAISAWLKHLLVIDASFPSIKTAVTFTNQFFYLDFATFPDATEADMLAAMNPFFQELETLGITLASNDTRVLPTFAEHYDYYSGTAPWETNITEGDRLIPRSVVQNNLTELVDAIRDIATNHPAAVFVFVGSNVTYEQAGKQPGDNSVLPAWRDALLLLSFGQELAPDANWDVMSSQQALVNGWQDTFRSLTLGGGGYLNEGTFDDVTWKSDYYGANYDALAAIKTKYDPDSLLWVNTAVGSDVVWKLADDGRLCRV